MEIMGWFCGGKWVLRAKAWRHGPLSRPSSRAPWNRRHSIASVVEGNVGLKCNLSNNTMKMGIRSKRKTKLARPNPTLLQNQYRSLKCPSPFYPSPPCMLLYPHAAPPRTPRLGSAPGPGSLRHSLPPCFIFWSPVRHRISNICFSVHAPRSALASFRGAVVDEAFPSRSPVCHA
jgi:hypothetical protein